MCNYQGYEFGAGRYPDSVCIDGRLFDADDCDNHGMLYEPAEDIPCPICKPKDAVAYWTERNRLGGLPRKDAAIAARSLVFEAGKHGQTNPYPTYSTNRGQWDRGYHEAMWEHDDEDETEDYN